MNFYRSNQMRTKAHAKLWTKAAPPILAVLLLLVLWQAYVMLFDVKPYILPSPIAVVQEMTESFPRIWEHTSSTVRIALLGFGSGTLCGLLLAVLLHAVFPPLKSAVYPLIVMSQNIPTIALGPLLIVWFGWSLLPKVLLITLGCFFPV